MTSSGAKGKEEVIVDFRSNLFRSFTSWGDTLMDLCDSLLCQPGAITSIPSLSLEPVFRRSHGSLYKALRHGRLKVADLRNLLVKHNSNDWPMVFAVDASNWERCDAETSPERGFYYSASKHSAGQPIVAGWSYQWIVQLNWEHNSWTQPIDVMRLKPTMDSTSETIEQVKGLVGILRKDREVPLFVFDAGYDPIVLLASLSDDIWPLFGKALFG